LFFIQFPRLPNPCTVSRFLFANKEPI
jgi:hypothetical protein